jgi:hypothetical protein
MKTSKIKEVVKTKDHANSFGTTIYHCLLMENGDKIEIGKKTLQKVGWELTYEVTDSGFEYHKAKSVKKEEVIQTSGDKPNNTQNLIVAQNSLTNAVNFIIEAGGGTDDVIKTMEKFYNAVLDLANGKG